ncbi:MAG: hypothetical protein ACON5A_00720 [Candidatus Comchoanobacterales bacterium]
MDLNEILMDEESLQKSRANRLKRLRRMTGMSRKDFSAAYTISQGTLQNWETGRFGGLTEKGARVILRAFRQEKIFCGFEWLMYGVGEEPIVYKEVEQSSSVSGVPLRVSTVEQDLDFMHQLHKDAITYYIDDDSMAPIYCRGSYVMGIKVQKNDFVSLSNRVCIVQTFDHRKIIRQVRLGKDRFSFNLHAINYAECAKPVIYNEEIMSAAPVYWVRYPSRNN